MANPFPAKTLTGDSQTEKFSIPSSFPSSSQLSLSGKTKLSPAASFLRRTPSNAQHVRRQSVQHPDVLRSSWRYKSQYPLDSSERHVEYILVASFHIDRGPIMEHQYPAAISGDESMLAELMLPDQTHVRSQDWTIFFLHKDTESDDEDAGETSKRRRRRKRQQTETEQGSDEELANDEDLQSDEPDSTDDEEDSGEGPPLMYVLNLVNTKQDNTARRGAVVKAMAICTRHSFLHIYKPLLLLALEDYFKAPYPETLASLYNAVNAMDLSLLPRFNLLERSILQASDSKDMFIEKFERMIEQRVADEESERDPDAPPESPTVKARYALPRDTHEFESKVVYSDIPIPVKVPTVIWPETVGDFSLIKLIQIFATPHSTTPQPFALHPHLTTNGAYTHPIIVLVNAMLTQKRVIFLGHNRPSGEVAEAVLAACALASGGILRGFTRHAFPYTDLTKIDDLLKVPGFVAGVTNPTFANHPEWWDLLCDLPTGRMKISSRIEQAPLTEGLKFFLHPTGGNASNQGADLTGDVAFMNDILQSINQRYGEGVIRAKWRAYIYKFTRVAAAFEETVYGASAVHIMGPREGTTSSSSGAKADPSDPASLRGHGYVWPDEVSKQRELAACVHRIEGWRNTRSYYAFIQDVATSYNATGPIKQMDLQHHHDRLRSLKLPPEEAANIYFAFSHAIRNYAGVCQLLTVTPESQAGLFYVSLGLFHPDVAVRDSTADLLDRIASHEAGRHFWNQVGRFTKLAYFRIKRDRDSLISPALSTATQGDPFGGPLRQQRSLVGIALEGTSATNRRS
ncbi:hypothetical protein TMatcc_009297 [Talaromyces marneffei ATCC 18224]|uniref:UDENN domain-containing protein n=1 Tax=Talaromyces marneffei (strain ATCC 18224 / CBS 334.59 / QM 7333) TaxID=441960 RepID=B6QMP6_TALMQ|nr:conserved hypothetical protein [Talaromyces marneffei ATCC 18224]KAE8551192.1 hypothetical protein EYB25_007428 [Talaromyces marneffei]